jgi:hypothetical protein
MFDPAGDVGQGNAVESLGDGVIKKFFRADLELAQNGFDFRPHPFDGVDVGTVDSMASMTPLT